MFLKQCFLALVGTSSGLLVAGGVFTVLLSVGLVPRFAGKTHTNKKVFLYEEMVVLGTLTGDFASVFERYAGVGAWINLNMILGSRTEQIWRGIAVCIVILFGFFAGIFVGCLALAIAEMLDSIPIFARRVQFRHGLGIAILAVALGKFFGSLLYFWQHIYLTTG